MYLLTPDFVRQKAIEYCEEHVFEFQQLSEEEREWYINPTIELLLENTEFKRHIFADQLN